MMTAREFAQFQNEYYQDRVKYENFTGTLAPEYQNPERYGEGTNWFETLTRTAPEIMMSLFHRPPSVPLPR